MKRAWLAAREALQDDPDVVAHAEATTHERHAAMLDALASLDAALSAFTEANRLTPTLYQTRLGVMVTTVDAQVERLARELREVVAPTKPWTRVVVGR